MASLTLPMLRTLARLYRAGVDGAAEQLEGVVASHAHELPDALGVPLHNLDALAQHEDPVAVLVATIEGVPRVARSLRRASNLSVAATLALRVAEQAEQREGGHIALDYALLHEALHHHDGDAVTFGARGSLAARPLKLLLRSLVHMHDVGVVLTEAALVVTYVGDRARGILKLVLHEPVVDLDTLVVPVGMLEAVEVRRSNASDRGYEPLQGEMASLDGQTHSQCVQARSDGGYEHLQGEMASPDGQEHPQGEIPSLDGQEHPQGVQATDLDARHAPLLVERHHRLGRHLSSRADVAPGGARRARGTSHTLGTLLGHPARPFVDAPKRRVAMHLIEALAAAMLGGAR